MEPIDNFNSITLRTTALVFILFVCFSVQSMAQDHIRPRVEFTENIEVNTFNGNLVVSRQDMATDGNIPINMDFIYNSIHNSTNYGFGKGWFFNYSMNYFFDDENNFVLIRSGGREEKYTLSGSQYVSPTGIYDQLQEYEPQKFKLKTKNGIEFLFDDATHKKLTGIADRNGNTIAIAYNQGNPVSIQNNSGRTINLTWVDNLLVQSTFGGQSFHYEYTDGYLTRVTNPKGYSITYQYLPNGKMAAITDYNNNPVYVEYQSGPVNALTSCHAEMIISFVDNQCLVIESSDTEHIISAFVYDTLGRVEKYINPLREEMRYVYDDNNNIINFIDYKGFTYHLVYDEYGNLNAFTDPAGQTTQFTYNEFHYIASIIDQKGNTTNYNYDSYGNLSSIEQPLNIFGSFSYDNLGNLIEITNSLGNNTSFQYNSNQNLTQIVFPIGSLSYDYDNYGNIIQITDANGHSLHLEYTDCIGCERVSKVSLNDSIFVSFAYDGNGNLLSSTDQSGKVTAFEYDEANRLASIDTPKASYTFEFDKQNNLSKITDANGYSTHFFYNNQNLLTSKKNARDITSAFEYDQNGNLILEITANGKEISYEYDNLNRLIKREYQGNADHYSYDQKGNLVNAYNNEISISYTYDALDRLTSKTIDNWGKSLTYTYDLAGNRTSMTDPDGGITTYLYDANNRLTSMTNPFGQMTTFEYDLAGNLTKQINSNGTYTEYNYNSLDWLITLTNKKSDGQIISKYDYTYDKKGIRLKTVVNDTEIYQYTYDDSNNLIEILYPWGESESFTYDNAGNRITHTRNNTTSDLVYDEVYNLLSSGDVIYTYDNHGNRTSKTENDEITYYEYDTLNRLIKIIYPDGSEDYFIYDPFNNIIGEKSGNSPTINYLYDGVNVLMEIDAAGATKAFHTSTGDGNAWISLHENGETLFYHKDALNSTTNLTNSAQELVTSYQYYAFGKIRTTGDKKENDHKVKADLIRNLYMGMPLIGDELYVYEIANNSVELPHTVFFSNETNTPLTKYDHHGLYVDNSTNKFYRKGTEGYVEAIPPTYIGPQNYPVYNLVQTPSNVRNKPQSFEYHFVEAHLEMIRATGRFLWAWSPAIIGGASSAVAVASNPVGWLGGAAFVITGLNAGYSIPTTYRNWRYGTQEATNVFSATAEWTNNSLWEFGNLINITESMWNDPKTWGNLINIIDLATNLPGIANAANDMSSQSSNTTYICAISYRPSPHPAMKSDTENNGTKSDAPMLLCFEKEEIEFEIENIASYDPNEVLGPLGYDSLQWVSVNQSLAYTILFENDPDFATAPAQIVLIDMPITENLNMYDFRLGSFGFGDFVFEVPPNKSTHTARLDVRDSLGVFVNITAGVNVNTQKAFWLFESIDPATGMAPEDALAGFLLVNDSLARGEGFVNFTIKPKPTTQTGDSLNVQAAIYFDDNAPIITNNWKNIVDALPPQSTIEEIIPLENNVYQISFSGEDDPGGSGISSYQLFVSKNSEPYAMYGETSPGSPIQFIADELADYRFFSLAKDHTGNREPMKSEPDATLGTKIYAGPNASICTGDDYLLASAFSAYPDFYWSGGDGTFDNINAQNPVYTPGNTDILNGQVQLCIHALDNGSIVDFDCMELTIESFPEISCPGNFTVPYGQSPFLLAGATPGGGTYTGPGVNAANVFNPQQAGPGSHTIRYAYTNSCGEASCTFVIEVADEVVVCNDAIIHNFPLTHQDICTGDVIDLSGVTAEYAVEIIWTVDPPSAGAITAGVFYPNQDYLGEATLTLLAVALPPCNDAIKNVSFDVNPVPVTGITGDLAFCEGQTVMLTASEGVSYLWSTGATSRSITVDQPGYYTVILTNEYGCEGFAEHHLTMNPAMLVNTSDVTDIETNAAVSGGTIEYYCQAMPSQRGVVWSTAINPTIINHQGMTQHGSGAGIFISRLDGLNPQTTYYVRAYATGTSGTIYGGQKVFTTPAPPAHASMKLSTSSVEDTHVGANKQSTKTIIISNTGGIPLEYSIVPQFVKTNNPDVFVDPEHYSRQLEKRMRYTGPELAMQKGPGGGASGLKTADAVIRYDNGVNFDALGIAAGATFYTAAYFPASTMATHTGMQLQQVEVYISHVPLECELRIYGQGTANTSGSLLHSQAVTTSPNSWIMVDLTSPLEITGEGIWIAFKYVTGPNTFPAGVDSGPAVAGFGDMFSGDGITWVSMANSWGLNYNLNIAAHLYDVVSFAKDVGVSAINKPSSGVSLTENEEIVIRIKNHGTLAQTNIPYSVSWTGGGTYNGNLAGPLAAGTEITLTLPVTADLSGYGTYVFEACTNLPGDENPVNNCRTKEVTNSVPELCIEGLYTSGCVFGDGLTYWSMENVTVENIPCSGSPSWYNDYTGQIHQLQAGETYQLTVEAGWEDTYFDVWIDFDGNYELNNNEELVINDGFIAAGDTPYAFDIHIPAGIPDGVYVMRARTNWPSPVTDPCATYTFGNCVDFTVQISGGTTDPWLSVLPESGTIAPGASDVIEVGFNSNGLDVPVVMNGMLVIGSNDPLGGQSVEAELHVVNTAVLPTVTTEDVMDVTHDAAVSGGYVANEGGTMVAARGLVWNTTPNPTVNNNAGIIEQGSGYGSFSGQLTALSPQTTYYVRAYATNSAGTAYGNQLSFQTLPEQTHVHYALSIIIEPEAGGTAEGDGQYPAGEVISLDASANPGYRFISWTLAGTVLGTQAIFQYVMPPDNVNLTANFVKVDTPPVVNTAPVSSIGTNQASGGGNVMDEGSEAVSARGVVWGFAPNPTIADNAGISIDGSGPGAFTSQLTPLLPSSFYYVRAYATSSIGTTYGSQAGFLTLAEETLLYTLSLVVEPPHAGTANGSGQYPAGTIVNVSSSANTGYDFLYWSKPGIVISNNPSFLYTMPANNIQLSAFYQIAIYNIAAIPNNPMFGNVTGHGQYAHGDQVILTANASTGYQFVNWTENSIEVSTLEQYVFTATGDRNLVANFIADETEIPLIVNLDQHTIVQGETLCFDALQTITTGGTGYFTIESGAHVDLIAGHNIKMLPGTYVHAGGYLLAKVAPDGPFCSYLVKHFLDVEEDYLQVSSSEHVSDKSHKLTVDALDKPGEAYFDIYPNPTNDLFRLELHHFAADVPVRVEVLSLHGETLIRMDVLAGSEHVFSLKEFKKGIYLVRVMQDANIGVRRVIKH